MAEKPEKRARTESDRLRALADWAVHLIAETNFLVPQGVVLRKFPVTEGHGDAEYMLYVDGRAANQIEAKKQTHALIRVKIQSVKYVKSLPEALCIERVLEGWQ